MNPSYPFYFNIDPDQTNLNEVRKTDIVILEAESKRKSSTNCRKYVSRHVASSSSLLVPQKKLGLKRPYLYEGSEENDPLSIISCIHVKNIEIKTKE